MQRTASAFICSVCYTDLTALFNPEMSILTHNRHPCTGNLNSETSGDSKNAFLHCGDVVGLNDCRWARKLLLLEFAFYMVWLLAFQVFMLLFQVSPGQLICCPAQPSPALPCPALPCPALPCSAPRCPALSHPALPLSCPALDLSHVMLFAFVHLACTGLFCQISPLLHRSVQLHLQVVFSMLKVIDPLVYILCFKCPLTTRNCTFSKSML